MIHESRFKVIYRSNILLTNCISCLVRLLGKHIFFLWESILLLFYLHRCPFCVSYSWLTFPPAHHILNPITHGWNTETSIDFSLFFHFVGVLVVQWSVQYFPEIVHRVSSRNCALNHSLLRTWFKCKRHRSSWASQLWSSGRSMPSY